MASHAIIPLISHGCASLPYLVPSRKHVQMLILCGITRGKYKKHIWGNSMDCSVFQTCSFNALLYAFLWRIGREHHLKIDARL
jgi:hypothetical protein